METEEIETEGYYSLAAVKKLLDIRSDLTIIKLYNDKTLRGIKLGKLYRFNRSQFTNYGLK